MKFVYKIIFSGLCLMLLNACQQNALKPEPEHELSPLGSTGQIDCTRDNQSCKTVDQRVLAP